MISKEFVTSLADARANMRTDNWQRLVRRAAGLDGLPCHATIQELVAGIQNKNAAWILSKALQSETGATWAEIASAMVAVDVLANRTGVPATEIIWSGPANKRFPVRRIDQVLYDLVSSAQSRIVLVTFAAHRVKHLCEHLACAVKRGVHLTLIVESEEESEGQLTRDAVSAFHDVPLDNARIYYWPLAGRERNQAGRPGKLHVKCAIVDNAALIGSANLTDDAFNRNMELGLLIRDKCTVDALAEHFQELIARNVLKEVSPHDARA